MLHKIKSDYREIKDGEPGRRFRTHNERSRCREGGNGTPWRTAGYVAVGLVLIVCGFVLSLPPGVPGFLLWIPGLALLASRFRSLAKLMDRLETWGRKTWRRLRNPPGTD